MRFTIVNFVYLFYTIVKGFYLSKLVSVTSTNNNEEAEALLSDEKIVTIENKTKQTR